MTADPVAISVSVKYGKDQLQIELPASSRISDLLTELEARTGLIVRKQKVMAKGKVVSQNPQATLAAAGIASGAKLMLLAAAGGAAGGGGGAQPLPPSAGAVALAAAQQKRAEALAARRAALGAAPSAPAAAAAAAVGEQQQGSMQQRAAAWAKTGVASVRDLGLEELPPELFDPAVAGRIRVLDAGGCRLTALPPGIAALSGLQRLRLAGSALREGAVDWPALAGLASLSALALDRNRLAALPAQACALRTLRALSLSGNAELAALPPEVSRLAGLRLLALRGCALAALPPQLGACSALEELDVRDNRLAALPPELARPPALRAILADRNRIAAVPPALLADARALCTLSLHGNPITAEALRETPGFAEFDARRKAKYDKKIGMYLATTLDEGADSEMTEMWEHLK